MSKIVTGWCKTIEFRSTRRSNCVFIRLAIGPRSCGEERDDAPSRTASPF